MSVAAKDVVVAWMRANGYKQSRLAAEIGAAQSAVSRWLKGKSVPDTAHQELLGALIGRTDLDWLTPKQRAIVNAIASRRAPEQQSAAKAS